MSEVGTAVGTAVGTVAVASTEVVLSEDQERALRAIKEGKNVFISGNAGSGKSFLINHLRKIIRNVHMTASTGIAAVNVGGQTIHSWAGIGLGNIPANKIKFSLKRKLIIIDAKILIIDEISMVSDVLLNLLNEVFKLIRRNNRPFGGLQIIVVGDFFQLPPVENGYCFLAESWQEADFMSVVLKTVFRQKDDKFVKLLNHVRYNEMTDEDIEVLKERTNVKCNDEIQPTIIVSLNDQANRINTEKLKEIESTSHFYKAKYRGMDPVKVDFLKRNCIAYDTLELKIGASVMMIKNSLSELGIINGSVGIVKDINVYPIVLFENGVEVMIMPEVWSHEKYDDSLQKLIVEASMEQVPLILAWSLTIHKCQGMTLKKLRCDLSRVFTYGQAYVALSRATTIEGLFIDDMDINKIRVNDMVKEFYNELDA